jgi:autotransporter-associated beta strand protein
LAGQAATENVSLQNDAALTLNGTIGTAADFHKLGAGTLTFAMASNAYTGDTYVDGGTLIGNTANINNVVNGAAGTTVEFNDTTDADLNEINTLGTFVQSGSAKLDVKNNAFTANVVNVNAGTFAANRALTANTLNVNTGAKLQGNGTITGDVNVNTGATLAPGNSIDTLTITGNLNLASGSTTAIEITDTPASDKIVVGNNANIAGGANLTVSNVSGRYFEWESFDIMEAANVAGTFTYDGEVTDYDTGRINVSVDYSDPTKVTLTAKRKATDYAGTNAAVLSRNESEVARAVDHISTGFGGDITETLLQLEQLGGLNPTGVTLIDPNATFQSALNELDGVLYANSAMLSLFNAKTAHVYDRIAKRNPSAGACPTCHDNVWVEYYNQYDKVYANPNSPRYTNDMTGVMAGYDRSSDEWLLGVYGGYGESNLRQRNDKMDIEDGTLGIYSGYMHGDWTFKGSLFTGRQNYYGKRHITFMNRMATARYEGWNAGLDLEGSYNLPVFTWMNVKPFAGVFGNYAHQQAFTEKDAGAISLHVESHDQVTVQGRLGIQLDGKVKNRLSWYGSVAVKQIFGNDYAKLHMSFDLPGTRMDIVGAELGRTYLSGQFGLNYALTDSLSLYGNIDTGVNDKSANCYGNIGVAFTW